ncbi:MAG: phage protease [Ramlibacter sp.]
MKRTFTAVLSASLALQAGAAVQILPFGEFAGRTGRPGPGLTWKVSDARGAALAAVLNQRHAAGRAEFNFDYDHQTMLVPTTGQKAPASGWASRFEWRNGVGLFATDTRWTAPAAASIDAQEYRYISPVISFDPDTGEVTDVLHASLTNFPDLMQMAAVSDAVAALNATFNHQENDLTLLASLLTALGLPAETTETAALTAVAAMKVKADKAAAVPTALSAALGLAATADEAAALSAVAALKTQGATGDATTLQTIQSLQGTVAALTAKITEGEVNGLVEAAIKDGKLLPAQKDWAIALGKSNVAQLSAFIKDAPAVAASLAATQSGGQGQGGNGAAAAVTGTETAVLSAMGLSADEFKAGAGTVAAA